LTAQEQENIETALASQTSVSDAHNAMVFYLFADSVDAFSELSPAALAHLYFVKVQKKDNQLRLYGYGREKVLDHVHDKGNPKVQEEQADRSFGGSGACAALCRVYMLLLQLTCHDRGRRKESWTSFTTFDTPAQHDFLMRSM
jgi:hypothetical protein